MKIIHLKALNLYKINFPTSKSLPTLGQKLSHNRDFLVQSDKSKNVGSGTHQ